MFFVMYRNDYRKHGALYPLYHSIHISVFISSHGPATLRATSAAASYDDIRPLPVSVLLENVRSLYNVGRFFGRRMRRDR